MKVRRNPGTVLFWAYRCRGTDCEHKFVVIPVDTDLPDRELTELYYNWKGCGCRWLEERLSREIFFCRPVCIELLHKKVITARDVMVECWRAQQTLAQATHSLLHDWAWLRGVWGRDNTLTLSVEPHTFEHEVTKPGNMGYLLRDICREIFEDDAHTPKVIDLYDAAGHKTLTIPHSELVVMGTLAVLSDGRVVEIQWSVLAPDFSNMEEVLNNAKAYLDTRCEIEIGDALYSPAGTARIIRDHGIVLLISGVAAYAPADAQDRLFDAMNRFWPHAAGRKARVRLIKSDLTGVQAIAVSTQSGWKWEDEKLLFENPRARLSYI